MTKLKKFIKDWMLVPLMVPLVYPLGGLTFGAAFLKILMKVFPLLVFPVGRAKALPKLRMGAITLPYPQTPSLGKGALSLCSDFDTQRQAESFFCRIHPELYFGAQVDLGGWPSGLTRPSDQSTTSRYLLPERDFAVLSNLLIHH